MYALAPGIVNVGNTRETFFFNQLHLMHEINAVEKGDFGVNRKYTFEICGKNKTSYQVSNVKNSFLVLDNLETCAYNKIPLWVFGFLY